MEISMISADLSWKQLGPSGAIVLAAFLPKCTYVPCLYPLWILQSDILNTLSDIRAILHLDVSNNSIGELVYVDPGWTKAVNAAGSAYEYTHTDGQVQAEEPGQEAKGVIAVVNAIKDMRALTSLNLASNSLGELVLPEGWAKGAEDYEGDYQYVFTHTEGTKQTLHPGKPEGILAVAGAIKDMGAISSINLLQNGIPVKQAQELVEIMQAKEKLVTLCGLSKEETELDFSGQDLSAGDAVLIANDISDMGAMTSLSLASNSLGVEGAKIIAAVLPKCT
jgi:hypothetical protein